MWKTERDNDHKRTKITNTEKVKLRADVLRP